MSHPHDGYDTETGVDYGPDGRLLLRLVGRRGNSMMSYIDVNWDFSQFDRDNNNRFQAAAYLAQRAGHREADPREQETQTRIQGALGHLDKDLAAAAVHFGLARVALQRHDYPATFNQAKRGYERVLAAAASAGVPVEPSYNGWVVLPEVADPEARRTLKAARRYSFEDRLDHRSRR